MKEFKNPEGEGACSAMAKSLQEQAQAMLKSHVTGYTRKDGAFVADHEDKRQAKDAATPFGVHHSKLKPGDHLFDKSGKRVDEVESIGPAMHASERTIHTRAGYEHKTQGGILQGHTNEKPGEPMAKALLFVAPADAAELTALVKSGQGKAGA